MRLKTAAKVTGTNSFVCMCVVVVVLVSILSNRKVETKLESVVAPSTCDFAVKYAHRPDLCLPLHVQLIAKKAMSCRNAAQPPQEDKPRRFGATEEGKSPSMLYHRLLSVYSTQNTIGIEDLVTQLK